jgi:hypothetical protein
MKQTKHYKKNFTNWEEYNLMPCEFYILTNIGKICLKGHRWRCVTDATICGDYEGRNYEE